MEYHNFSVAVGGQQVLEAEAGYIRFDSISAGNSYPTIEIRSLAGDRILLKPGTDVKLREARSYWIISNYDAQNTIAGVLQIGHKDEKIEADRISGEVSIAGTVSVDGEVSTIDGGRASTESGIAFIGADYVGAGGAGNFSEIQLLNPSGSGKVVTLRGLSVGSGTAGLVQLSRCDSALATLVGNAVNKNLGGSASSAQIRHRNNSASLAGTAVMLTVGVIAYQSAPWPLLEPLRLQAGEGVVVYATAGNNLGWATFEFLEETA